MSKIKTFVGTCRGCQLSIACYSEVAQWRSCNSLLILQKSLAVCSQITTSLLPLLLLLQSSQTVSVLKRERGQRNLARGKEGSDDSVVLLPFVAIYQHVVGSIVSSCRFFKANLTNKGSVFLLAFHLKMIIHSLSQKCSIIWLVG